MQEYKNKTGWKLEHSYAELPSLFHTTFKVNEVPSPRLVILNEKLAVSLGLDINALKEEEGVAVLAGNKVPEGGSPLAQAYAGHQFGNFTMLGDGRALLYGEQITPDGKRVDIQLKGSGKTKYSRGGDGRAALGPMLREFIISEAMHGLGIETTRSLAVTTTGERVLREGVLTGSVMTRTASSHIRVGTFEYAARWGTKEELQALADYTIERHYPELNDTGDKYLSFLQKVIKRQAALIAKWQLAGFIHGVMNTDNMSISGETIDYGPCAFMDSYDPKTVFSSIDMQGRYSYQNQPAAGGWNLARFAEALLPLLDDDQKKAVETAQEEISRYIVLFQQEWMNGMRAKLGLSNEETEDEKLAQELLELMQVHHADFTNTFRALTLEQFEGMELFTAPTFKEWHQRWQERLDRQEDSKESVQQRMKTNNPAVIPRNHRVEEALTAAEKQGDYSVMGKLLHVLSDPYVYSEAQEAYKEPGKEDSQPYRTYCGT
ncbi:uncharacterized protein YdiU (UPF0061 family) [Sinobaca qinghaiensis]|uniref:Protein nucleotidyltransferase YdiU n=2 Tax=Sinobaca qinghaiensis TaxID=342944 RepID=A0A419UX89_9BACL|nr:uncharacterized protein YdiU (UPF0061 family) [Sinobaca qinghaiensis]